MFIRPPRIAGFAGFLCGSALLASCLPFPGDPDPPPALRAYFLDVGQGDACALRTPENRWFLVDVGDEPGVVARFLRRHGVDSLDGIALSHPDRDHTGALRALLHEFPVQRIFLPAGDGPDSAWRSMLSDLDVSGAPKDTLFAGDTLEVGSLRLRTLWPRPHAAFAGNDLSTVLRAEFAGRRILLTGDIRDAAEKAMLRDGADPAADILKVPHHGSRTSSGMGFLEAVHPEWAIISCDSAVYGHPHAEALADLAWVLRDEDRIVRTDRSGTAAFELDEWGVRPIGAD